ncbi:LCP family protein [Sporosarcina saromensis]|uniref:Polyisoprenyl-teichoic acid--peptidoglycan teichoic acid transferase TagU n=1 Tax=Sporosarcina saromensis TaxID=359365 RepID=A0ABU4G9N4_9BACL|nr:LCP family protein [Sporosarcina saromensis]MDW0113102.1 LCP family protein [Sporosarcina saromensis]
MKKRKFKKWQWIVATLGLIFIGILIFGISVYMKFTDTVKEIHKPLDRTVSEKREEPVSVQKQEPFSVLLLGVDEREGDKGRSDTIIVLTVNPTTQSTKMLSIPRDTYTEIVGKGFSDKINHAYAFGGIDMSLRTVEQLLDIPIDYTVQVNMDSFKEIVDAVGGITIENPLEFKSSGSTFKKGQISLSGEEALTYIRMRYEDPRGDFGRQDRQKLVVQAILREGASLNSLLNYRSIFNAVGKNVRTNMDFDEIMDVQKNYNSAVGTINQLFFEQGTGKTMNGIWYYIADEEELEAIQNELRTHLAL